MPDVIRQVLELVAREALVPRRAAGRAQRQVTESAGKLSCFGDGVQVDERGTSGAGAVHLVHLQEKEESLDDALLEG